MAVDLEDVRIRYVVDDSDVKRSRQTLQSLTDEERQLVAQMKAVNAASSQAGDAIARSASVGKSATRQQIGIIQELQNKIRALRKEQETAFDEKRIKAVSGEIAKLDARMAQLTGKTKSSKEELNGVGQVANRVGALIGGALAVGQLQAFAGKVIDITSQFQKLQAVLRTALGSETGAQQAFAQIQDFAATTNFSVLELTDSYVKLTNQGFKPTSAQLENLADIANSTGKDFGQLTEAILDASNSFEFERLKEFGISAKQQGDQVALTFKGVTTVVDKTSASVRDYIVGLGDLEGVSGSTAAISETLGGRISNLGDAVDNLFASIGNASGSSIADFIGFLTASVQAVDRLIQGVEELKRQQGLREQAADAEKFAVTIRDLVKQNEALGMSTREATKAANDFFSKDAEDQIRQYSGRLGEVDRQIGDVAARLKLLQKNTIPGQAGNNLATGGLEKQLETLNLQRLELANQIMLYKQRQDLILQGAGTESTATVQQLGLIEELQAKIKALREEQEKSQSEKRVLAINGEVRKLQDELDRLLGKTKKVGDEFAKLAAKIRTDISEQDVNLLESLFGPDDVRVIEARAKTARTALEQEFTELKKQIQKVGREEGRSSSQIRVQIELADEAYRKKLELLEKDTRDKINKSNREYEEFLTQNTLKALEGSLTAQQQQQQQALDQELIQLGEQLRNKEISLTEYGRRRVAAEKRTSAELLENEISTIERQIRIAGLGIEERTKLETDLLDKKRELADQEVEIEKEKQQRIREIAEQGFDVAVQGANALFEIGANRRAADLDNLKTQQESELRLVGDNQQAQQFIKEEFARKERAVKIRQAQADKQQALFNIAVNTAASVIKTSAQLGYPAAIPFVALALASGAIQAAVVASRPIPKFRRGVIDLKGPGTESSDSIHAMLSRGESVMTAKETRQFQPTLLAIRKGTIDPELLNAVAKFDYKGMGAALPSPRSASPEIGRLVSEQRRTNRILSGLPLTQIQMNERGFKKYIRSGDSVTEILNDQFPA